MEYMAHHELRADDLLVKVCVPRNEAQARKSELKTEIVQARKLFHQNTAQKPVT